MALSMAELAAPLQLESSVWAEVLWTPLKAKNPPVANSYYLMGSRPQISPLIFKSSCHTKEKPALNVCHLCPCTLGSSYHRRDRISAFRFWKDTESIALSYCALERWL